VSNGEYMSFGRQTTPATRSTRLSFSQLSAPLSPQGSLERLEPPTPVFATGKSATTVADVKMGDLPVKAPRITSKGLLF
jgi:hypothetical protein